MQQCFVYDSEIMGPGSCDLSVIVKYTGFLIVEMGQDAGIDITAIFLRIFGIYAFYINFSSQNKMYLFMRLF